jgi:HEXXH motif-containing protein
MVLQACVMFERRFVADLESAAVTKGQSQMSNLDCVPPPHRLTTKELDSLAGGWFEPNTIRTLLSVERSRRLLLLRAVRDGAQARSDAAGPLPSVDDAWALLLQAERADAQVVDEMLADPQAGTWVGHTLRRLRNVNEDQAPLWFHVGQLHALAVAAAIRAGIEVSHMRIPVWNGIALLPTLGYARLPVDTTWGHAEVTVDAVAEIRYTGKVITVDPRADQPIDGWFPTTRVPLSADGQELLIRLDDATAYRGLDTPAGPVPLSVAELSHWRALLDEAWSLLVRQHPQRAAELAIGMTSITPTPTAFRFRPRSSSVEDGFGAAILSEPYDAVQLAVTLVHEFQHSLLNGLRHVVKLVDGDDPATGYAAWRDDPRPLEGIIHGVFAFAAITEFWAVQRKRASGLDADLANFEFALWRRQTATVLRAIQRHHALTTIGSRFLQGIGNRLDGMADQPVSDEIASIADVAADDHVASWTACHQRPDPDHIETLATAWTAGQPAPRECGTRSTVEADRSGQRLDVKAALIRVQLTDPDLFHRLHAEPHLVPGATSAEVAFVAGDFDRARQAYLSELSDRPDRALAWSGLGLTLAAMGEPGISEVLLRQPHVLRALMARLAGTEQPGPEELAAWLAREEK